MAFFKREFQVVSKRLKTLKGESHFINIDILNLQNQLSNLTLNDLKPQKIIEPSNKTIRNDRISSNIMNKYCTTAKNYKNTTFCEENHSLNRTLSNTSFESNINNNNNTRKNKKENSRKSSLYLPKFSLEKAIKNQNKEENKSDILPGFNSSLRAKLRANFELKKNLKDEEKKQEKSIEILNKQKNQDDDIKNLRKSMVFKALPLPERIYKKIELKKN